MHRVRLIIVTQAPRGVSAERATTVSTAGDAVVSVSDGLLDWAGPWRSLENAGGRMRDATQFDRPGVWLAADPVAALSVARSFVVLAIPRFADARRAAS